jgi:hypothetical protein
LSQLRASAGADNLANIGTSAELLMIMRSLLVLALFAVGSRSDYQLMTSPAFESFAHAAEEMCPARKLRYLHPADLDGIEEAFLPSLSRRDRRRVAADLGFKGCPSAGASCPAQHTLSSIVRTGMLDNFVRFSCSSNG